MSEAQKTVSTVAKYNAAIDAAMAALDAVCKEKGMGARITLVPAGRPDGSGKPTFTGSRSTVMVRPGQIPLSGPDGAFFYKIAAPSGKVE